jgi:hypothetical protein
MSGKGVAKAMRAHPMYLACLRVYKVREASSLSTFSHYLPSPVPIYAKNNSLPVSEDRAATADIFFEHYQSLTINRQHPLTTVFLLFDLSLLDLAPALWAEGVAFAKLLSATDAGHLKASFQMLNGNCATYEVYVFNG